MSDLQDLKNILVSIINAVPDVMPQVATSMSLTAKSVAERTIKDKGFGQLYSDTKVPAWFMKGKELNKRGLNYILTLEKNATEDEPALTNWGEFRQAQGLQTAFVDLSYSNKMWAGMFPQDVQQDLYTYIAPLGNNTREGQDKMNWNFERYGDFLGLALTGDGIEAVYDVGYDEFIRLITPYIEKG